MKALRPLPRLPNVELNRDIQSSPAWICLNAGDQRAYLTLMFAFDGKNNGYLSLTHALAKKHGIKSKVTVAKNLNALNAVGLIAISRQGGSDKNGYRLCNLFRLTDKPVDGNSRMGVKPSRPTNEWKSVLTVAAGRDLIKMACIPMVTFVESELTTYIMIEKRRRFS